jgi:hypothetical protein
MFSKDEFETRDWKIRDGEKLLTAEEGPENVRVKESDTKSTISLDIEDCLL